MIITHNLQAMRTTRIVNNNINEHAKSTAKISSGYKINVAVDNPAGLAMSEAMRRQLRGLMQGTYNTKDGVSFVQIADGAMGEIHEMLQRMNELSLKSATGLCTQEERAALNAELDQLRTEIDRINDNTTFNTMPVFDEHEASYYQISGNRKWDDNQLHTITSTTNELNIHLPDEYDPKDYTLTVPPGTYTTQELMDEIDDALGKMVPPNPGFVFEYTSDGYCNLNFENAEGEPTKIKFVDGSLAYLIYDFQPGGSPASLLGTSLFGFDQAGNPLELEITKGKNDELGFYAESAEGEKYISITVDPGHYTRDEMIEHINQKLAETGNADGIVAKPYGENYIQITGGDTVNITGLKGNMFKYEPTDPKYTSVFYDNEVYGSCDKTSARITGQYHQYPIRIYGDTANKNNVLYFKLNGDTDANVHKITIPAGDYTVSELTDKMNELLAAEGLEDEIEAINTGSCMQLISKKKGSQSKLSFDINPDVDPDDRKVFEKAYEILFKSGSGDPYEYGQPASVTGSASLNGKIVLDPDATLSFKVDGKEYTVGSDILGGEHASLGDLINKLNNFVANTPALKDKIEFTSSGNRLVIKSKDDSGVKNISISGLNETYKKLFTSTSTVLNGSFSNSKWGSKEEIQGRPGFYNITPASITASPCKMPVTIDGSNSQISLSLYNATTGKYESISFNLDPGTYNDMTSLEDQINLKLSQASGIYAPHTKVTCSGNSLTFTFTPPQDKTVPDGDWRISVSSTSVWRDIFGTSEQTSGAYTRPAGDRQIIARYPAFENITLNNKSGNNKLTLEVGGKKDTLTINGTFNSRAELISALQDAINRSSLKGKVEASLVGDCICLTSTSSSFTASGTFYDEVILKGIAGNPSHRKQGTCTFDSTCVIGREDMTTKPVKIIEGLNDILTFDFTFNKRPGSNEEEFESFVKTIDVKIPEGVYQNGYELANILNTLIKEQYGDNGELSDDEIFGKDGHFNFSFSIGGYQTDVYNSIDPFALQIKIDRKDGQEPGEGEYIVDGVRGNASCFVFYKTASQPAKTYIVGTKDISDGITFEPGKNVLTLTANSVPLQYTFEENKYFTAEEFIDELNKKFAEGDDNGNRAPLRATLEDGVVKIWHKTFGANTITDIGGSGRGTIFFEEEGRDSRDPLILQVGAEQRSTTEIPRIRVNSCSLEINSITISQAKYADKAIERIKGAIKLLSSRRSTYGAIQNRLEHTINNNENIEESMQASDARIRDTDMSSELIRYSNLNILLQAGSKMIAQSNNNIKKLLTILG